MKTKTRFLLILVLVISMALAACSKPSNTSASASGTQSNAQSGDASLPLVTQLAVGTLKLEDTDQAVTAEQAADLLTLWQAYQALSNSDTTASAELDAVIKQIQGAMTPEQIKAIEDMQLTRQSMGEVLQSLGMDFGAPAGASGTPAAGQGYRNSGDFPRGGGEGPGGGSGGGGFTINGGGFTADGGGFVVQGEGLQVTPDASTRATMQARSSTQASRVSPMLLNALIKVLETKSQPSQ